MTPSRIPLVIAVVSLLASELSRGSARLNADTLPNPSGQAVTLSPLGTIDQQGPFFQSLGSNGRSCNSCHQAADGWSITPANIQARFDLTEGLDPLFRLNDGANSPQAAYATVDQRRAASSMLLNKGLIRVGLGIPANAEFTLAAADDPYGYASAKELSLFRRPLPAANLRFLSTVMWDGRQTFPGNTLAANLTSQTLDAIKGHAEATSVPTDQQLETIVNFESSLFLAQAVDSQAGPLDAAGALGAPGFLPTAPFYVGINDPLGQNPTIQAFNRSAFTIYRAWENLPAVPADPVSAARRAIGRGEVVFNTKEFNITGVSGLNDELGVANIRGTCTTCHDTPNVGNHSVSLPLNIGLTDANRRTSDLPLYTLQNNQTGATVQTTDPGRALITGQWKDIGRFKGPILRGLAARAPYFHDGSAATLDDVVQFYDDRFRVRLSRQERADLVAFLRAL